MTRSVEFEGFQLAVIQVEGDPAFYLRIRFPPAEHTLILPLESAEGLAAAITDLLAQFRAIQAKAAS